MADEEMLERTNRMNVLFDFYGSLLTKKQQSILELYYQDNFSLGEIAAELSVTRQAVYEHLKRAEASLEEYESKLRLAARSSRRNEVARSLARLIEEQEPLASRQEMLILLEELQTLGET